MIPAMRLNCSMRSVLARPFTSLRNFVPPPSKPCTRRGTSVAPSATFRAPVSTSSTPDSIDKTLDPGLYLVGTPIGNLEDITFRALRVLRSADKVLCEDTRVTSKLLNFYGIKAHLESYHQHNERSKEAKVLSLLRQDAVIALVSDAGMPCINDPGAQLASAAAAAGVPVIPIPGPSSVLAALVGSGLPSQRFTFCGYTPPKSAARRGLLLEMKGDPSTLLFFVSPHALLAALGDACEVLGGERRCCVARELTKVHEEFWRGTLEGALREFTERGPRGEVTLVIEGSGGGGGGEEAATDEAILEALARAVQEGGVPPSQAAREVAAALGAPRKRVYSLSLTLQGASAAGSDGPEEES